MLNCGRLIVCILNQLLPYLTILISLSTKNAVINVLTILKCLPSNLAKKLSIPSFSSSFPFFFFCMINVGAYLILYLFFIIYFFLASSGGFSGSVSFFFFAVITFINLLFNFKAGGSLGVISLSLL